MSKWSFKKLLKEKTNMAAFKYLTSEQSKQSKICNIVYSKLDIQEYLLNGDRNVNVSKCIFKGRSKTLDIKVQKKWRYEDIKCSGCRINDETGNEMLNCKSFCENDSEMPYDWFYSDSVEQQISVAKTMMKKLKVRQKLREEVT
jgi:hypothetical protein